MTTYAFLGWLHLILEPVIVAGGVWGLSRAIIGWADLISSFRKR